VFPLSEPPDGPAEDSEDRGTIDWKRTMTSLRTLDADCPLLLELKEVAEMAAPLRSARESFERLERLQDTAES
jgi:hypothetical protein